MPVAGTPSVEISRQLGSQLLRTIWGNQTARQKEFVYCFIVKGHILHPTLRWGFASIANLALFLRSKCLADRWCIAWHALAAVPDGDGYCLEQCRKIRASGLVQSVARGFFGWVGVACRHGQSKPISSWLM